jgi:two-component system, chemotaxis family, protein-glutamate methylesterase/glutaminase
MGGWINREKVARDVIVIGASAGGIAAVIQVLAYLPEDLDAIVGVVIHRGDLSKSSWAGVLGRKSRLRVLEPMDGDVLAIGTAYVAPSDRHMRFESGRISLDDGPKQHFTRPAVDSLFVSAARTYGPRVVGVVLTGGGQDGTKGLISISEAGGLSLVQKPSDADDPRMPASALANDHVRAALPLTQIGEALVALARGDAFQSLDPERERNSSRPADLSQDRS